MGESCGNIARQGYSTTLVSEEDAPWMGAAA